MPTLHIEPSGKRNDDTAAHRAMRLPPEMASAACGLQINVTSMSIIERRHGSCGMAFWFCRAMHGSPMHVRAADAAGGVRGVELEGYSFFANALFQRERGAFMGQLAPLLRAFSQATHQAR